MVLKITIFYMFIVSLVLWRHDLQNNLDLPLDVVLYKMNVKRSLHWTLGYTYWDGVLFSIRLLRVSSYDLTTNVLG